MRNRAVNEILSGTLFAALASAPAAAGGTSLLTQAADTASRLTGKILILGEANTAPMPPGILRSAAVRPAGKETGRFQEFAGYVRENGYRQGDWDGEGGPPPSIDMIRHGPILEEPGVKKYAIEFLAELRGRRDCTSPYDCGPFIPEELEFSRMEMVYCNFIYKDPKDYRFLRRSMTYSLDGEPRKAVSYRAQYDPAGNTGVCSPERAPVITEKTLPLDPETTSAFAKDLAEWMSEIARGKLLEDKVKS